MDDWVTYDLPPHLVGVAFHGRYRGQKQKWFALRFTGGEADINLTAHEPEFSAYQWVAMADLPGLIVPFKRDLYAELVKRLSRIFGRAGAHRRLTRHPTFSSHSKGKRFRPRPGSASGRGASGASP